MKFTEEQQANLLSRYEKFDDEKPIKMLARYTGSRNELSIMDYFLKDKELEIADEFIEIEKPVFRLRQMFLLSSFSY